MSDEAMDAEKESMPAWVAKTLGYVVLTVFATTVLVNAIQSFFFEEINRGVTLGACAAMSVIVSRARRHRLAREPKAE